MSWHQKQAVSDELGELTSRADAEAEEVSIQCRSSPAGAAAATAIAAGAAEGGLVLEWYLIASTST